MFVSYSNRITTEHMLGYIWAAARRKLILSGHKDFCAGSNEADAQSKIWGGEGRSWTWARYPRSGFAWKVDLHGFSEDTVITVII